MKSYKCNKCGSVFQIEVIFSEGEDEMDHVCLASFPQRTSGICAGELVPFEIKPAPCKDCD